MPLHIVKDYRKKIANLMVIECDGCGDVCDWTACKLWHELIRYERPTAYYCSDACLYKGAPTSAREGGKDK